MSTYQILEGDCRTGLAQFATGSVQTCISSPPYWNLRDYGVAGQIGLEPLPDCLAWARQEPPCGGCFVCSMRNVYGAELRRVLADDGTVWVNLGDTYSGSRCGGNSNSITGKGRDESVKAKVASRRRDNAEIPRSDMAVGGLQAKNLLGIPWRVALALQADGWVLRQDIIWHKPNPMPESVGDRCTKAHEYIFLLSKSPRYYFDAKAIQEPALGVNANGFRGGAYCNNAEGGKRTQHGNTRPRVNEADRKELRTDTESRHRSSIPGGQSLQAEPDGFRNKRSVWTVATQPYAGAHFATFPPELIRPCVLASSMPGELVLDLFNGSGTTGQVALEEGRLYVGLELNPDYIQLTHKRLSKVQTRLQFSLAA